MRRATGIDPAATGPAARADVEFVAGVYVLRHWRAIHASRKPILCAAPDGTWTTEHAHTARTWLVEGSAPLVAVEATPPLVRGAQAVVTQAEAAGAIVQAVGAPVLRPLPRTWRQALGVPTDAAALAAWGWATVHRREPLTWAALGGIAPPTWAAAHVAEAACMAVWALRQG